MRVGSGAQRAKVGSNMGAGIEDKWALSTVCDPSWQCCIHRPGCSVSSIIASHGIAPVLARPLTCLTTEVAIGHTYAAEASCVNSMASTSQLESQRRNGLDNNMLGTIQENPRRYGVTGNARPSR